MIECKKFLTMERVKVHRELFQHLKAFTYKNECQEDKILNIEDLILMSTVSKSQLYSVTLNVNETLLILESYQFSKMPNWENIKLILDYWYVFGQ